MCSKGKLVSKYFAQCDPITLKWSDCNFWLLDLSGAWPPALSYDPQPWHFCKLKACCLIYFFIAYVNAVALTKLKCQKFNSVSPTLSSSLSFSYIGLLYLRTLKGILTDKKKKCFKKYCQKQPCRGVLKKRCSGVISINFQSNFIEITLRHGCSPVNFLHIFRTPFPKNTPRRLLL